MGWRTGWARHCLTQPSSPCSPGIHPPKARPPLALQLRWFFAQPDSQTLGFPALKSIPRSEPLAPQPSRRAWLLDPAAIWLAVGAPASSCASLGFCFPICTMGTKAAELSTPTSNSMTLLLVSFFPLFLCSQSPPKTPVPCLLGGPPATQGTPLGQWVGGLRQRQHEL